jgi:hypothetical protein
VHGHGHAYMHACSCPCLLGILNAAPNVITPPASAPPHHANSGSTSPADSPATLVQLPAAQAAADPEPKHLPLAQSATCTPPALLAIEEAARLGTGAGALPASAPISCTVRPLQRAPIPCAEQQQRLSIASKFARPITAALAPTPVHLLTLKLASHSVMYNVHEGQSTYHIMTCALHREVALITNTLATRTASCNRPFLQAGMPTVAATLSPAPSTPLQVAAPAVLQTVPAPGQDGGWQAATGVSTLHRAAPSDGALPLRTWGDVSLHAWLHATGCGDAVPAFLALGLNGVALDGLALVIRGDAAALNHWLRTEAGIEPPSLRLRLVASLARLFAGVCAG